MHSFEDYKPLNYLFLSYDRFPPFRVDLSILFGKELASKTHQIEFVLQSEKNCSKAYVTKWSGCKVHVGAMDNGLSLLNRMRKNIFGFINDMKCIKLILRKEISGVIIKDKFFSGTFVALFSKLFNKKCVYWLSFPHPESDIYRARGRIVNFAFVYFLRGVLFKNLLYRCLIPLSHHVFVQSEQMKKDIQKEGADITKVTAVPMCVQMEDFEEQACTDLEFEDKPKVVYIGALDRERRIDFVLRTFKLVLEQHPDANLFLVGSSEHPEDISFLHKEAELLGVKHAVTFTGFLPRKKALAYVRNADVCLSPFYPTPILNSTSPTKIIEYMAMGKPVVANQHPEQSLIIEQSKAGICVPYNEIEFSKAVVYLLNHTEEGVKMGYRGRRYVEKYRTYKNMAVLVDKYLREIFTS